MLEEPQSLYTACLLQLVAGGVPTGILLHLAAVPVPLTGRKLVLLVLQDCGEVIAAHFALLSQTPLLGPGYKAVCPSSNPEYSRM